MKKITGYGLKTGNGSVSFAGKKHSINKYGLKTGHGYIYQNELAVMGNRVRIPALFKVTTSRFS